MALDAHKKAVIAQTPDSIGSQQVNFVRSNFDDLVTDKGYQCFIERALRCPCTVKGTGQGLSDCLNCGGSGWFFIDKQQSIIVCTSISNRTRYSEWTESNAGTVNITTRPEDRLAFMDRVILTELESIHKQVVYPVLNDAADALFAFLTYKPLAVFEVYLFIDSNTPLQFLEQGTDYTFTENKITLNFATFGALQNLCVTIRYLHNPVYHIIDINRELIKQRTGGLQPCSTTAGGTKLNLPINCIGRKAQFVFEQPDFAGNSLYDNTNYTRTPINYDY